LTHADNQTILYLPDEYRTEMPDISLADAKSAKKEVQQDGLRDNDAGVPDNLAYDYETDEGPIVQVHPETLLTFEYIAGLSVLGASDDFLNNEQNLQGGGENGRGNDVLLALANPTIVKGELWVEDDDFREYRLVGDLASDTIPYEERGDYDRDTEQYTVKGVDLGMGQFDGQRAEVNGFDTEYVQLLIKSRRVSDVLGMLDTAGMYSFDGETFTGGIIERPPIMTTDDYDPQEDPAPRAIGYPELRADMVGQRGAISWTFADEDPTQQTRVDVNVYRFSEDGDLNALAPPTPGENAYAKPTYPRAGNVYWDHGVEATDVGADTEPETTDGVAEAKAALEAGIESEGGTVEDDTVEDDSEDADNTDDGVSFGDLTEDGQEFVEKALDVMEELAYDSATEFDDFDERVETTDVEADAAELAQIIDERVE